MARSVATTTEPQIHASSGWRNWPREAFNVKRRASIFLGSIPFTSQHCSFAFYLSLLVPMASRDCSVSPTSQNSPLVSPSAPASVHSSSRTKRKHSQSYGPRADVVEDSRPSKQTKRSPTPLALSEDNLQKLNAEIMDGANSMNGLKRTSSRHSRKSGISQDTTQTQSVSVASASYRYNYLADAQVFFHADPPDHINTTIHTIIEAKIADKDRAKLKDVARQFHTNTMKVVRASVGVDDFLGILTRAFEALNKVHLCHRAKSGWREELKPASRQPQFNLDFLTNPNLKANGQSSDLDEALPPPLKRQQRSVIQTYMSPSSTIDAIESVSTKEPQETDTMPPPATPSFLAKEGDRPVIKTPRPDLSIGILNTTLNSRLSTEKFNEVEVEQLLRYLQAKLRSREPGKQPEPILISVPAPRASDLTFPFIVVEGKAYSTGKQMFEAENQAAVSGACGLKIQLCLDDLVQQVNHTAMTSDDSPTPSAPLPLFFSVCTEGPIHALWAHYTRVENGVRKFKMTLLNSCNAVRLKDLEEFLVAFYNVCSWGTGGFLDSVVERLGKVVANLTAASHPSG